MIHAYDSNGDEVGTFDNDSWTYGGIRKDYPEVVSVFDERAARRTGDSGTFMFNGRKWESSEEAQQRRIKELQEQAAAPYTVTDIHGNSYTTNRANYERLQREGLVNDKGLFVESKPAVTKVTPSSINSNSITIAAEERMAMDVKRPDSFVKMQRAPVMRRFKIEDSDTGMSVDIAIDDTSPLNITQKQIDNSYDSDGDFVATLGMNSEQFRQIAKQFHDLWESQAGAVGIPNPSAPVGSLPGEQYKNLPNVVVYSDEAGRIVGYRHPNDPDIGKVPKHTDPPVKKSPVRKARPMRPVQQEGGKAS